ncbi:MAG TPA: isocitrate lyase/phosphoenolpyruvate mutase family protein [Actinomycetota bacterium]|nr:isocitrate lyase/phosphoenolpyruvate mutase family protein [Actinomycetota bacterium]
MSNQAEKAAAFLALHDGPEPLILPNPWDAGSAGLLESLGYRALATTSGGFAATLGRLDGQVTRDEALAHAATIVAATGLPVSADLENGFGDDAKDVVETVRLAREAGLAGCSIEDFARRDDHPIYDLAHAVERIAAAAEEAHRGDVRMVLTARTENYLHGRRDLDDTIQRLKAFEDAGADVLFAPGVVDPGELRAILEAITRPLNVLIFPGVPKIAELAEIGVRRISTGSALAYVALGAMVDAARQLRDGSYRGLGPARTGAEAVHTTFGA